MTSRTSAEIPCGSKVPSILEAVQHKDAIRELKYGAAIAATRFGSSFAQSSSR
jgi:hypothetical protein